jgi:hypothetical protein
LNQCKTQGQRQARCKKLKVKVILMVMALVRKNKRWHPNKNLPSTRPMR